ncbi:MAG: hypothetical protein ACREDR_27880 [Blastocatellia bacterium]
MANLRLAASDRGEASGGNVDPAGPLQDIAQRSPIYAATGEEMLSNAIALTLKASPAERAELFEYFTRLITAVTNASDIESEPARRPWICGVHSGTDGSRIFLGGIGYSIVIDPNGRLWRAGTVEDFETTYDITATSCEIASMTPLYANMKEYLPRDEPY